ncbi:MAG: ATP-binding protein [Lysobacterales bacterium]
MAILRFTGAGKLDLWFEDGDLCYHWQAEAEPDPAFHLSKLSSAQVSEQIPPSNPGSTTPDLIDRVLSQIDDGGQHHWPAGDKPHDTIWLGEAVVMRFDIDARNTGVLRLTKPEFDASSPTQVESYEDLAQLLGVAISNRRAKAALMERVKELTCMYRIAHIAAEPNVGLDDMLQKVVELLPVALQYPGLAKARIVLGQHSFCSSGFEAGPHCLSVDLIVLGEVGGRVEVFYTEPELNTFDDLQFLMEEPFLAEEQHLMVGVARELNAIIERKHAEEEKLQLREQVRHADRLVTVGQLAAGVAHELNEPLGNILGFAQLAIKSANLTDQTRRDIEKIEKASLYAREIIRKLMFFSRQTPSRKSDVSLQGVVEDSLSLLESRCETAGITVVWGSQPALPLLHGDPSQLQQVVVNLVVNAIQSMPEGGVLTIDIVQETDRQCLIVEDTGSGIAPGDIKNVFLPFFTTKEVGEGTGLGLSVVHGIVSSHGGTVKVESKVGSGTRFEVRFPTSVRGSARGDGDEK